MASDIPRRTSILSRNQAGIVSSCPKAAKTPPSVASARREKAIINTRITRTPRDSGRYANFKTKTYRPENTAIALLFFPNVRQRSLTASKTDWTEP